MSKTVQVSLDLGPLHRLAISAQEAKSAFLKVGVLGDYADRTPGQAGVKRKKIAGSSVKLNNPTIGAIQEFGSLTRGIPPRSFLRMPIMSKLKEEIAKESKETWATYFQSFGFIGVLRAIGEASLSVIKDAFDTGGFGRWAKNRPFTIRKKGHAQILVDTGQLRDSITYAVVAPGATKKPL